jgi:hypothetical protein
MTAEHAPEHEQISQWEFLDEAPTRDQVLKLLETLPLVLGVSHVDFIDYVVPLSGRKKFKVRQEREGKDPVWVDREVTTWTLYMTVPGRMAMADRAAAGKGWRLVYRPDPELPGGVLHLGDVPKGTMYREWAVFQRPGGPHEDLVPDEPAWVDMEGRCGMAGVQLASGRGAAGTNPWEKAETAARGRALGAFGFGVFPGSGLASLEEMTYAAQLETAGRQAAAQGIEEPKGRDALVDALRDGLEELRRIRGAKLEEVLGNFGGYLESTYKTNVIVTADDGQTVEDLNWEALTDGRLLQAWRQLRAVIGQEQRRF